MDHFSVKSFAKINLGLLITGKRKDGYHTLETIFAPINWYDTIGFSDSDVISMSCSNIDLPVDDNNLCITPARALQQSASCSKGAAMNLQKVVPFGAGLGGGSSDAATVLRVLNELWKINVSSAELHELAVKLGADVPYFLEMKGLAFARGIGDELEDLGLTLPFHVVTVFPEEHISTVWAYKNFYHKFDRPVPDLKLLLQRLCLDGDRSVLGAFENDFEPAVFDYYPKVRVVKESLLDAGSFYASLSGSGSAVFGLFDTLENAAGAVCAMQQKGYRVTLTPPGFSMEAQAGSRL
jgi:4-diphosphocytidyl-2-C-methyl-D-erythritol kinase